MIRRFGWTRSGVGKTRRKCGGNSKRQCRLKCWGHLEMDSAPFPTFFTSFWSWETWISNGVTIIKIHSLDREIWCAFVKTRVQNSPPHFWRFSLIFSDPGTQGALNITFAFSGEVVRMSVGPVRGEVYVLGNILEPPRPRPAQFYKGKMSWILGWFYMEF